MMKRSKFLVLLTLFAAAASFTKCGSDSPPPTDPQDEQLTKLTKTWKFQSGTFNSAPIDNTATGYGNFVLTMTGTAGQDQFDYTTTGRPPGTPTPWPAAGKFTFGTDFATLLIRNDYALPVTYSVSATQLQMTFDFTCPACNPYTGRTSNVSGVWSFTFGL